MIKKKYNDFKVGDIVVYPKHGVGEIMRIESMKLSNIKSKYYVVKMEQAKLTIRVPLEKQQEVGLRKISSKKNVEEVYNILKSKPKIRRIMWSRRAQEYETKILSGNLVLIAEVLKELYKKDTFEEASFSEKQIYAAALDRLARELAAMKKLDKEAASKELENILKSAA